MKLHHVAGASLAVAVLTGPHTAADLEPGPTFSEPLAIDHPLFPFPAPEVLASRCMGNESESVYETSVFETKVRVFEWDGQSVTTRVVCETEIEDEEDVESSENYFAQADDGSVWYFGESVTFHQEGATQEPSWTVGGPSQDDPADAHPVADPMLFLPAEPVVGEVWFPENVPGVSIEISQLIATDVPVVTSKGTYPECWVVHSVSVRDGERLHFYAPGTGLVLDVDPESWQEFLGGRNLR